MKKKGLSGIVMAIILIALVLVAAFIVWTIISNLLGDKEEEVVNAPVAQIIKVQKVFIENDGKLNITFKRLLGPGPLQKIRIVLTNSVEEEEIFIDTNIKEDTSESHSLTPTISNPTKVFVYPVTSEGDKDYVGIKTDEKDVCDGDDCGGPGVDLGDGSEENPYKIYDCEDLQNIQNDLEGSYILMNDIDCSDTINWKQEDEGKGFVPIGVDYQTPFEGTLDGNCFEINNLYIDFSEVTSRQRPAGLFASVHGGKIHDLSLIGADIKCNSSSTGIIAADIQQETLIERVYVKGNIYVHFFNGPNPSAYTGGIVGTLGANSQIIDSYSDVYIDAKITSNDESKLGGIAGLIMGGSQNNERIIRSYSVGDLLSPYRGLMGGIVGWSIGGSVEDSFSIIEYGGWGASYIGGIVGQAAPIHISNCGWNLPPYICVGDIYPGDNNDVQGCVREDGISTFYGSDNPVVTSWDFENVWEAHDNDLPTLRCQS
jgi:hypothetical protein